ncbi:ATP-binding protein [Couchioplanes caeruleus]|uniref:ATP-binding protein n=1 Tax=Couchioplanes caeruleus TaxID=56438 RepID=UPI0020C0271D|nr:ATP-binding protein [Couchioplanes caeruleus]UQU61911.1 ATP-binding protein [Couchioplanes caeruleus]
MEVIRPYLFAPPDPDRSGLSVTCDLETGILDLAVRGRFGRRAATDTFTSLRKCLAEHPAAIVVDLVGFEDPLAASAAMWVAINRKAAALHPPVRLALAVEPGTPLRDRLTRLGVERYFPVRSTPAEARAAASGTVPWTQRLQLIQRAPDELSTCAARNLVGAACEAWRMPDLLHPARIIVSELVTNAVEHAGTDVTVTVWRRGAGLHLSVRDGDPRLPRLLDASSGAPGERGAGLRIVGARATAWGAMATHDGKLVWATLRGAR